MRRLLVFGLIIPVLFMCGCSSSSSGGSDAPAADYSGTYKVVLYDNVHGDAVGDLYLVQDGKNVGLTYQGYAYDISTSSPDDCTIVLAIKLNNLLIGTGVGRVRGRKIDTEWATGAFTRLEFSAEGTSFMAYGDASFAGIKKVGTSVDADISG